MLINGTSIAREWRASLKKKVARLKRPPRLLIVLVGHNQGSVIYVNKKIKAAKKIGVVAKLINLSPKVSTAETIAKIKQLSPGYDGIIVQLPLPPGLDRKKILSSVPVCKDVDGLSQESVTRLIDKQKGFLPATVRGIIKLIKMESGEIRGLTIAIVGAGILVGRPLSVALKNMGARVVIVEKNTATPQAKTKKAQVIVASAGVPGLIDANYVAPDQLVIDAGFTLINGKPTGDVVTDQVEPIVKKLVPVPGGVGPMTVSALMANLVDSATCSPQCLPPKD